MPDIYKLEKDALVVFIDLHRKMLTDNGALPGWPIYYKKTMEHVVSLAEYCQRYGIAMLNRQYRPGDTCAELARFNFDFYEGCNAEDGSYRYGPTYSQYSKVYFCGLSLDQCVMRRHEGYIWTPHKKKVVIRNCSLQGLRRLLPVNYVKRWLSSGFAPVDEQIERQIFYQQRVSEYMKRFDLLVGASNEADAFTDIGKLKDHVIHFLQINGIPWIDWRPGLEPPARARADRRRRK